MKNRGVFKVTACALAGALVFTGSGVTTFAAGEMPLAGLGADIQEQSEKKESAGVVAVPASGYETVAIAQVDEYVNIRDAADTESGNVVGKLYDNSAADILGQEGDWYLIQSGDVVGYVNKDYFVTGQEAQQLAQEVGTPVATVNTETLMVREDASTDSDVISLVGDSEQIQVVEDNGDWVKVQIDSDVTGYVAKEYVECETKFVEAESIEEADARVEAVEAALDRAEQMKEAAIEAMNSGNADEAAYASYEASAAAAEAKQMAAQQALDYEAQEKAASAVASADEAAYAAYQAEEIQAANEAAAAAQAEAEAYAAQQAQAEAQAAADAQAQADAAAQAAADAQAQADAAAQAQLDAEAQAQAQAEADAAAQAAADAQAQADAAAQAEAEASNDYTADYTGEENYDDTTTPEDGSVSDVPASSESSSLRQSVVNYALQFVGNPYVYGGTSLTNGTDCSGFTQGVLANFGISIPRTAASQAGTGTPVDMSNLQPGDLLFYDNGGGIGHVTMYIGNGQVVHASSSTTGIIVSSVDYRTPCAARSYL